VSEEQKLQRELARHRDALRLTSDRRAVAALRERIAQMSERLNRIKKFRNQEGGGLQREQDDQRTGLSAKNRDG
jgi:CRP-like cAMP-binding protein